MEAKGVSLRQQQLQAIRGILNGKDVIAKMPTGSGKSMIFQALLVSHAERGGDKLVIVITPLNAISFTHKTSFERVCVLKRTRDD